MNSHSKLGENAEVRMAALSNLPLATLRDMLRSVILSYFLPTTMSDDFLNEVIIRFHTGHEALWDQEGPMTLNDLMGEVIDEVWEEYWAEATDTDELDAEAAS